MLAANFAYIRNDSARNLKFLYVNEKVFFIRLIIYVPDAYFDIIHRCIRIRRNTAGLLHFEHRMIQSCTVPVGFHKQIAHGIEGIGICEVRRSIFVIPFVSDFHQDLVLTLTGGQIVVAPVIPVHLVAEIETYSHRSQSALNVFLEWRSRVGFRISLNLLFQFMIEISCIVKIRFLRSCTVIGASSSIWISGVVGAQRSIWIFDAVGAQRSIWIFDAAGGQRSIIFCFFGAKRSIRICEKAACEYHRRSNDRHQQFCRFGVFMCFSMLKNSKIFH